ncbi:MAG: type II/IV secretion system protein [Deltaproteobacteria bacterium]|nr:type II/IV secretion system protein [Deltaproteobacteria bacterium]
MIDIALDHGGESSEDVIANLNISDPEVPSLRPELIYDQSTVSRRLALCSTEKARALVDYHLAMKLAFLPIAVISTRSESSLSVIVSFEASPNDIKAIEFATGLNLIIDYEHREAITQAIFLAYHQRQEPLNMAITRAESEQRKLPADFVISTATQADQAIPNLLNLLLDQAICTRTSDIHIEPLDNCYRIRFRQDGILIEQENLSISAETGAALFRRIRVLSDLDITRTALSQEGGFLYEQKPYSMRIRVSILSLHHGEKAVLRILDNNFLSQLQGLGNLNKLLSLGLDNEQAKMLELALASKSGTLLFVGPTGSGKSTLLYACLNILNDNSINICTIEDPVERVIRGICQGEIDDKCGRDYDTLLRDLLRQDPDVIMLGEIREKKTADTALSAGLTGHLVLSTLHTGNCIESVFRLLQFNVAIELIITSVKLIVAQRLVRKNCSHCLEEAILNPYLRYLLGLNESQPVFQSRGCEQCSGRGYQDRIGVFEILPITRQLQDFLVTTHNNKSLTMSRLQQMAIENGYRSLNHSLRSMLLKSIISPAVALETVGISPTIFNCERSQ